MPLSGCRWSSPTLVPTHRPPAPSSHSAKMLPVQFPKVTEHSLKHIWYDSFGFNRYRGDDWMPEPCRSCDEKEKDFGGCRCQALLLTGSGSNSDPACSKSPHHQLIQQAVQLAQHAPRPGAALIPRHASQGVDLETAP